MYRYDRFQSDVVGFVELPFYEDQHDISTPSSDPQYTALVGGSAFLNGPDRGLPKVPYTVTRKGTYIESDPVVLRQKLDALAAACWGTGKLWRTSITDPSNPTSTIAQWKYAYLESIQMSSEHAGIYRFNGYWCQDVVITFSIESPLWNGRWHGKGWVEGDYMDIGTRADYNPAADTVTLTTTTTTFNNYLNRGNRAARAIEMLCTVGATALTSLEIFNTTSGHRLTCTYPAAAGEQFLIDTGRQALERVRYLTAAVNPADKTISVDSTGIAVGTAMSVVRPNGRIWLTKVATVGSGFVTVAEPGAPGVLTNGARVGFGAFYNSSLVRQLSWNQDDWFWFAGSNGANPGVNNLTITRAGGGSGMTVFFTWSDAFA